VRGARWVQQWILGRDADTRYEVYAIWFSMIDGDERDAFQANVLTDLRVTHLWDEERVVGRWFAENVEVEGCDDEIIWDAFYVFGPDATWTDKPGPLACCGFPIWGERKSLRDALAEFRENP
jgi:hypothetical protein